MTDESTKEEYRLKKKERKREKWARQLLEHDSVKLAATHVWHLRAYFGSDKCKAVLEYFQKHIDVPLMEFLANKPITTADKEIESVNEEKKKRKAEDEILENPKKNKEREEDTWEEIATPAIPKENTPQFSRGKPADPEVIDRVIVLNNGTSIRVDFAEDVLIPQIKILLEFICDPSSVEYVVDPTPGTEVGSRYEKLRNMDVTVSSVKEGCAKMQATLDILKMPKLDPAKNYTRSPRIYRKMFLVQRNFHEYCANIWKLEMNSKACKNEFWDLMREFLGVKNTRDKEMTNVYNKLHRGKIVNALVDELGEALLNVRLNWSRIYQTPNKDALLALVRTFKESVGV